MARSLLLLAAACSASASSSIERSLQAPSVVYTPLPSGRVTTSTIFSNGTAYFSVELPVTFSTARIGMAPLFGNPDLFVCVASSTAPCGSSIPSSPGVLPPAYSSVRVIGNDGVDVASTDTAIRAGCSARARDGSTCSLRVAIVSRTLSSRFTVSLTVDGAALELTRGVPFAAAVPATTTAQYSFTASGVNASSPINFILTPISGSTAVYVASTPAATGVTSPVCASFVTPSVSSAAAAAVRASLGAITLRPSDPCFCPPPCSYSVSVAALTPAVYTFTATEAVAPDVALADGQPQDGVLSAGNGGAPPTAYYSFSFNAASMRSGAMSLTLTQFMGAVSVYAVVTSERTTVRPSATFNHYSATPVDGVVNMIISTSDVFFGSGCTNVVASAPLTSNCVINIAVVATGAARLPVSRMLQASITPNASMAPSSSSSPSASPSPAAPSVSSSVSASPSPSPSPFAFSLSSYTLVLRTDALTVVEDGVPLLARVALNDAAIFRYVHTASLSNLVLGVSTLAGSVNMYVGTSLDSYVWWTSTEQTINATSSIVIAPTHPVALACPGTCTYFIKIVPSAAATGVSIASLLARSRTGYPSPLIDGQSLSDVALAGDVAVYSVPLPAGANTTMTIAFAVTSADQPFSARVYARVDGALVSPSSFQYSSRALVDTSDSAFFTISRADAAVQAACPARSTVTCAVQLLVQSTATVAFTLSATSGNRVLPDGATFTGIAPEGGATYYVYFAAAGASRVVLTMTVLSGGATMYVSTSDAMPSATSNAYASNANGDPLVLDATTCGTGLCAFYIAVVPSMGAGGAIFRISASSARSMPIALDQPVAGRVGPSTGTVYYSLVVPPAVTTGVEVTVESLSGGYVSVFAIIRRDTVTGLPVIVDPAACPPPPRTGLCSAIAFSALGLQTRTRLYAPATDARFTAGTTWIVALTASSDTSFIMTAALAGDISTLATNVPQFETLGAGAVSYYRVYVSPSASSLILQATPTKGDITMYVAFRTGVTRPTAATAEASAGLSDNYNVFLAGQDIRMCPLDPQTQQCIVYVAIAATYVGDTSAYELSATVNGAAAVQRLLYGVPHNGIVRRNVNGVAYFAATLNVTMGAAIQVSVLDTEGSAVWMVSTNGKLPNVTAFTPPPKRQSDFGSQTTLIGPSSPQYITSGVVYIAVLPASGYDVAAFIITVSTTNGVIEAPDGTSMDGVADAGTYAYYSLEVGAAPGDVTVALSKTAGSMDAFVSKWVDPLRNPTFRPTAAPAGHEFQTSPEGTLAILASDPRACVNCTYLIAVLCANTTGSSQCEFVISLASANALTRLTEGMASVATLVSGFYRYFFFEVPRTALNITFKAVASVGSVRMVVSSTYIPYSTPTTMLPRLDVPGTFMTSSATGDAALTIVQNDTMPMLTNTSIATLGAVSRIYTLGVVTGSRTAVVSLTATAQQLPTLLVPGTVSSPSVVTRGNTVYFVIDVRDPTDNYVIVVNTERGNVAVTMAGVDAVPVCSLAQRGSATVASCANGVWQATTQAGSAEIRIVGRRPCNSTAALGTCTSSQWGRGIYTLAVTGLESRPSPFTVLFYTRVIAILDGQPTKLSQPADASQMYLRFSTQPDVASPPIRLSFDVSSLGVGLTYYINSCLDVMCTDLLEMPGPGNAAAVGTIAAGMKPDIAITSTSAAYCRGSASAASGSLCMYFIAVVPIIVPSCGSSCRTMYTLTATQVGTSARISLDYSQLQDRVRVLANTAAPGRLVTYKTNLAAGETVSTSLFMRLDACDMAAGYLYAYICEDRLDPMSNMTPCRDITTPSANSSNYVVSTTPDTPGGNGRALFGLTSFSDAMYISLGVPRVRADYAAVTAKFGASNFELALAVGSALYITPATVDAVGATITVASVNPYTATLKWTPPMVMLGAAAVNASGPALNVTYIVYFAPFGFAGSAANVTNTPFGFAGILPTTPCGLDRWAGIVAANYTPITMTGTSLQLTNLVPGMYYEANVVAICDFACIMLNAAVYGGSVAATSLDTLRMPYRVMQVQTLPPVPVIVKSSYLGPDAVSSALIPLGFILFFAIGGGAGYVMYRYSAGSAVLAKRYKELAASVRNVAGGGAAMSPTVVVTRDNADAVFKPKAPALRRALDASASTRAVSTTDTEQYSMARTLATRLETGSTIVGVRAAAPPMQARVVAETRPAAAGAPSPAPVNVAVAAGVTLPAGSTLPSAVAEEDVAVPRGPGRRAAMPRVPVAGEAPAPATEDGFAVSFD